MLLFLLESKIKNMTETLIRPEMIATPDSIRILESVGRLDDYLSHSLPEYCGATLYGSASRGKSGPESDADTFIFVRPSENAQIQSRHATASRPAIGLRGGTGLGANDVIFDPAIEMDYKWPISRVLADEGVRADIDVLPISEEIVDLQVEQILANAARRDSDANIPRMVPRNVRGLFHAPIGNEGLRSFQRRVIERLEDSPHGESAWRMIRHMVVGFEQGRGGDYSGTHRGIPVDLASAREQFVEK